MLAVVALLQVSVATPPSLDDARRAPHAADTAAAVSTLIGLTTPRGVRHSSDIAAFELLRWIGRSADQKAAQKAWDEGTDLQSETAPVWRPRDVVWLVTTLVERGFPNPWIDSLVLGRRRLAQDPSWQVRIRQVAEEVEAGDAMLAAAARWTAARGWLSNFDRFARTLPEVEPDIGCQHGCALARWPPGDLQLLSRIQENGAAAASLDKAWTYIVTGDSTGLFAQVVGRRAALDSVFLALNEMQGRSPWPFSELGERLRVTLCALLRLTAESRDCAPLTTGLDSVVGAELRVVRYEAQGSRRLAAQAMEAVPQRFAALDQSVALLLADSTMEYVIGPIRPMQQRVPAPPKPPPPMFWETAWPLYLLPYNERLVAHRARLLLADMSQRLAFGPSGSGLFGAYGNPGTLVRIGVPVAIGRLPAPHHGSVEDQRFPLITYMEPGTHETIVRAGERMEGISLDFALAARSDVNLSGVSGFAAEDYDAFEALDHQVVRYTRGGHQELEVYVRWDRPPRCTDPRPTLGFFLLDAQLRQIVKPIQLDPSTRPRLKRLHLTLAPGVYVYSLEMLDRGCREARRGRYVLTVPPADDQRGSDLMLTDELYFGDERWVARIKDRPPVTVRPALTLPAGSVARFYWELYGIEADAMQAGRLNVTFEVVNVRNQRVAVREIRELAQEARKRAGTLDVKYELAVPPGDGPLGFGLAVGIPEGTKGVHVARVRVTDTKTKSTVTAERAFFVRQ